MVYITKLQKQGLVLIIRQIFFELLTFLLITFLEGNIYNTNLNFRVKLIEDKFYLIYFKVYKSLNEKKILSPIHKSLILILRYFKQIFCLISKFT